MLTNDKAPEPKPMNDSSDPTKSNKKALSDRPFWEMTLPTQVGENKYTAVSVSNFAINGVCKTKGKRHYIYTTVLDKSLPWVYEMTFIK